MSTSRCSLLGSVAFGQRVSDWEANEARSREVLGHCIRCQRILQTAIQASTGRHQLLCRKATKPRETLRGTKNRLHDDSQKSLKNQISPWPNKVEVLILR